MENNELPPPPVTEAERPRSYHIIQLVTLIMLMLMGGLVFGLLSLQLAKWLFGVDFTQNQDLLEKISQDKNIVNASKLIQLGGTIGTFAFSCFLYTKYIGEQTLDYLGLSQKQNIVLLLLAMVFAVIMQPFTSMVVEWNMGFVLPESMAETETALRQAFEYRVNMQRSFLAADGIGEFLLNILLMAAVPAFVEELFFRRLGLRILFNITRNAHVSILLSALAFALVHYMFYQVIPMFLFGLIFGYLAYWTGSIWVPVAAHFANNAFALTINYLAQLYPENQLFSEEFQFPLSVSLLSLIAGGALLYLIRQRGKAFQLKQAE